LGIIVIAGIAVGVVVAVNNQHKSNITGTTGSGGAVNRTGSGTKTNGGAVTPSSTAKIANSGYGVPGNGGNGSIVKTDLGVEFTYVNQWGGNWAMDPLNPYTVSMDVLFVTLLGADALREEDWR